MQPALFVAGELDCVLAMNPRGVELIDSFVPNLRNKVIIPGVGHWTQQERAAEVSRLMVEFLKSL
jgi:epoxide hydrolase A/B